MDRTELAKKVYRVSNLKGSFLLRSGRTSGEYFDKYRFESDPALLLSIAQEALALVPAGIDCLAGLELGGVPLAVMLAQVSSLPVLFIRKAAKEYGTCRYAEGGGVRGRRLLIVEDVVSTGGAVIEAVEKLRADGASIMDVLCAIDRETGGEEKLAARGLRLRAVFRKSELEAAAS